MWFFRPQKDGIASELQQAIRQVEGCVTELGRGRDALLTVHELRVEIEHYKVASRRSNLILKEELL